jgi:WD40 repeat protein
MVAIIWSAKTGNRLAALEGHCGLVESVAFSPNGKVLATAGQDSNVLLWNPETGERLAKLDGHQDTAWAVTWAIDGESLISGSEDRTARLWDLATREEWSFHRNLTEHDWGSLSHMA